MDSGVKGKMFSFYYGDYNILLTFLIFVRLDVFNGLYLFNKLFVTQKNPIKTPKVGFQVKELPHGEDCSIYPPFRTKGTEM